MCGIVGLFAKAPEIEERLGVHLAAMLVQMSSRGPDSAGVAVYRDPAPSGSSKLTLYSADPHEPWNAVRDGLREAFGECDEPSVRASHAVLVVGAEADDAEAWVRAQRSDLRVMSAGQVIEIYKETGLPEEFVTAFALDELPGHARARPHAHGDREPRDDRGLSSVLDRSRPLPRPQRLALESQPPARRACGARASSSRPRTTPRSRPAISRGACARARRSRQALEGCLDDLDGFYTFAVGTADGFAVLRDPIACKPAVLAETDDWVAMSSEWRSIAVLPGAADAEAWEPEPGVVYAWDKAAV